MGGGLEGGFGGLAGGMGMRSKVEKPKHHKRIDVSHLKLDKGERKEIVKKNEIPVPAGF